MKKYNYLLEAGASNNSPQMIVVHAMGEYLETKKGLVHARNFLEDIGLSAHALIEPNGDVIICRNDNQGAYHARGYNKNSLGVEFLVSGAHTYGSFLDAIKGDYVTEAQYQSGAELLREWIDKHHIKKIFRHSDLSPERKVDPGEGFKWLEFLEMI